MKIALSIIITLLFGKEVISVCSIVIFFRNKNNNINNTNPSRSQKTYTN